MGHWGPVHFDPPNTRAPAYDRMYSTICTYIGYEQRDKARSQHWSPESPSKPVPPPTDSSGPMFITTMSPIKFYFYNIKNVDKF